MEGNGPGSGDPRHLGLVLGSEDPFALDEVCAALIGCDTVPTQEAARALGRIPDYTVTGGDVAAYRVPDFVLPPLGSTLFRSVLPGKAGEVFGRIAPSRAFPSPGSDGAAVHWLRQMRLHLSGQGHSAGESKAKNPP